MQYKFGSGETAFTRIENAVARRESCKKSGGSRCDIRPNWDQILYGRGCRANLRAPVGGRGPGPPKISVTSPSLLVNCPPPLTPHLKLTPSRQPARRYYRNTDWCSRRQGKLVCD